MTISDYLAAVTELIKRAEEAGDLSELLRLVETAGRTLLEEAQKVKEQMQ